MSASGGCSIGYSLSQVLGFSLFEWLFYIPFSVLSFYIDVYYEVQLLAVFCVVSPMPLPIPIDLESIHAFFKKNFKVEHLTAQLDRLLQGSARGEGNVAS